MHFPRSNACSMLAGMAFVRWHYRAGVYVRSHHRRRRSAPGADQTSLLPALIAVPPAAGHRLDTASGHDHPIPMIAGQRALPFAAGL